MKKEHGKFELPPLVRIGQEIGNARKRRRMSTLRVSQTTRIPERYVRCIESGDFASLPGKPFVFGFTRTICALLGLDADAYIPVIRTHVYGSCTGEARTPARDSRTGSLLRRLRIGRG